jgi:hypothetical protein
MHVRMHRLAIANPPVMTDPATTAARFDTIFTGYPNRAWLASLRATNPTLEALLYQETYARGLAVPANGFASDCHAGVSIEEADATPAMYEKTAANAFINNPNFGSDRLLNVGRSDVRTAWSGNSRARALAGSPSTQDFSGVFGDDVNYHLGTSGTPADYANDAAWWAAQKGMYQTIYPDFTGAGLHLVPNLGGWQTQTSTWDSAWNTAHSIVDKVGDVLPYVDGALEEFFTVYAYAANAFSGWWHHSLGAADRCIAAGKRFYAQSHGSEANALYAFASLMMAAHATDASLQSFGYSGLNQDYANEYWPAFLETDIGTPVSAREEVGSGALGFRAFRREFSNGWAAVNPAYNIDGSPRSGSVVVALDGGTFTDVNHTSVTTVTLAPGEGAVLSMDPAIVAPPPVIAPMSQTDPTEPVHLSIPLRRVMTPDGLKLATDVQGTAAEVDACVFAAINTPLGWRTDLPEFGRPGQAHRRGGANLAEIERVISMWEPRADLVALRDSGRLAEMAADFDVVTISESEE